MRSLTELSSLSGRVAVVTGGAGHIGSMISATLVELGAAVVVLDIDLEQCREVARRIDTLNQNRALPLAVDLQNDAAVRDVARTVVNHFGRLDILVNCAALAGTAALKGWAVPFPDQSPDTWRKALDVNLTAAFVLSQACAPALAEHGKGTIVNISSIYGMVGPDMQLYDETKMGNPAAYAASKGGLIQLTRWMSTVLAPRVRVNAISPGGIWRQQPEIFCQKYISKTPLRRMGTEEDLKGAVAFLSSDMSEYVTGHNLVVDGGWTAW